MAFKAHKYNKKKHTNQIIYTKGSRIKRPKRNNILKVHNGGPQDKGRYWKHVAKTSRRKKKDHLKTLDTITRNTVLQ